MYWKGRPGPGPAKGRHPYPEGGLSNFDSSKCYLHDATVNSTIAPSMTGTVYRSVVCNKIFLPKNFDPEREEPGTRWPVSRAFIVIDHPPSTFRKAIAKAKLPAPPTASLLS